MTGAVPSGIRAVLAENLIASMLDLEVASANDQTFSSGYSPHRAHPDADAAGHRLYFLRLQRGAELRQHVRRLELRCGRFDDYNILQRDLMVDGGLRPVTEAETIAIRQKAARAIRAVFRELGPPPIADEEVEAATYAHGSNEMPPRNVVEDLSAVEEMMKRNITGLDIVGALSRSGFEDIASNTQYAAPAGHRRLPADLGHSRSTVRGGERGQRHQ